MLDLITVVFRDEIPLLKIQAKSVDQYVTNINSITIIVNDDDSVAELIDPAWWGQYCQQVKIKPLVNINMLVESTVGKINSY